MNISIKANRLPILLASILLAILFLVATAGPNLAAPSVFDWDTYSWPTGSLSETYTGVGSPATVFTYTFSGDTGRFESDAPETNHSVNGGTSPPQRSLFISTNYITNTESVTLTVDLSNPSTGVSFVVFDVDRDRDGSSGIDSVTFTGFNSLGVLVTPTLTATFPSCVNISGNIATGMCNVNDNQDDGNVTATFGSEVSQIVLNFMNAGDPLIQKMALHDINFDPGTATPTPTSAPPTAIPTDTPPPPTNTPTETAVPPTATPTETAVPPTATPTETAVPPTATPTETAVPPTATPEPDRFIYLPVILRQW